MFVVRCIVIGLFAPRASGLIATDQIPDYSLYKSNISSAIPENGHVCFQGTGGMMDHFVSTFRAGPLNKFSPHSGVLINQTCESLGFTQSSAEHSGPDGCYPTVTKFFRPEADADAILNQIREESLNQIKEYADSHHLDIEFVKKWVVCVGGCAAGKAYQGGLRWWGADRVYTEEECAPVDKEARTELEKAVLAEGKHVGAFTDQMGKVCWQGELEYLRAALHKGKNTPLIHILHGVEVQETTCEKLGFDQVRDTRDECWVEASKNARSETGNSDILDFVFGVKSKKSSGDWYDYYYNLPNGTSIDWIACGACEKGGADRDRGMLKSLHGGTYLDRYSDEFCSDLLSRVGPIKELPEIPGHEDGK